MKRPADAFTGAVGLLTDVACMQVIMTSFSYFGRGDPVRLDPYVWALGAFALFFANLLITRTPVPLPALVAANAAVAGAALFALIATAPALSGFFAVLFTVVFLIITAVEAFRFSLKPRPLNAHLLFFDVYLLLLGWYFLSLEGGLPGSDLAFLSAVLALNIICNIALRATEENVGLALSGFPVSGVLFQAGFFAAVLGAGVGLALFLAQPAASLARALSSAALAAVVYLFALINRFFTWLFSLFPSYGNEVAFEPQPAQPAPAEDITELIEISPEAVYAAVIAVACLIAAALIFLLIRFRKKRVSGGGFSSAKTTGARAGRIRGRAAKRLRPVFDGIVFFVKSALYINTPPGTFVSLERRGKKHDNARAPGQPMREWLLALSEDLAPLADDLDRIYYGGGTGTLSKTDCRAMRRDYRKKNRRRPEKHG